MLFIFTVSSQATHEGYMNKGNDHQLKKLLIVKQILQVSTMPGKCIENCMENMHTDIRV